jgi:hypothetical protein
LQLLAVTPAQPEAISLDEQYFVFAILVEVQTLAKHILIQLLLKFRHASTHICPPQEAQA